MNIFNSFTNPQKPLKPQKKLSHGGKVKNSQVAQPKNQPQSSTTSYTSMNNTWRPLVHCSTCGGDHLRKGIGTPSVPGVGPDHITQRCVTHLQNLRRRVTFASTVAARITQQASVQTGQMTTGRNPGQHQGTFRNAEQVIQVVIIVFSTKIETLIIKQGFMKDLTGNTCIIITIISHLP